MKMKNDNKININNDNAEYFINKVKHTLTSKYDINKNDLMSIGEFIDFLKCEGIEDVTLKNMRDWDNKGILPAYRVPQGKSREDVSEILYQWTFEYSEGDIVFKVNRFGSAGYL